NGPVVTCQGGLEHAETMLDPAAIAVGLHVVRLPLDRLVVASNRSFEAANVFQSIGALVVRLGSGRVQLDGLVVELDRPVQVPAGSGFGCAIKDVVELLRRR